VVPAKARHEYTQGLKRLKERDLQQSVRHFTAAIAAFPGYYEAYYHLGIAELGLQDYTAALQSFQRAIDSSQGKYPRAEFGYGLALCRQGQDQEAERIIRHGLQAEPNLSDGYVALGVALLHLRQLDEAEKAARESLLMNDSRGTGYLVLSDVHSAQGNFRAQAEDLNSYLKLKPDDPDAIFLRKVRDTALSVAARKGQTGR
jgi:tetratricopeptide (TPR) repeat protein